MDKKWGSISLHLNVVFQLCKNTWSCLITERLKVFFQSGVTMMKLSIVLCMSHY